MKTLRLLFILGIGFYACQPKGPKVIEGRILSKADSLPIPGASISEWYADSVVQTIWADSLGNFKLEKQSPGDSLLVEQHEVEAFNDFAPARLRASAAQLTIYLDDAVDSSYQKKIRGVVRAKHSKQLLNEVAINTSSNQTESRNGRFIMGGNLEDTVVVFKSPGYKTTSMPASSKSMSVELELDPNMKKIAGRVHQQEDKPLCGIHVLDEASGLTSSTDENGRFEMFATSAGTLSIGDPDNFYMPTKMEVNKVDSKGIELKRAAPQRREGLVVKITDIAGGSLPGVNVLIAESPEGTVSDPCGVARFEKIDRNRFLVFSFIGYKEKKLRVSDLGDIVVLEQDR
jgi:hypothetical protein